MSAKSKVTSQAGLCKIAIVVLGIIIMGVGLHSHFESAWKKSNMKIYKICDILKPGRNQIPGTSIIIEVENGFKCPKISMEQFFVSMVIIFFILSLLNLIGSIVLDTNTKMLKLIDLVYHVVAGVLLFAAAAVYLASAVQIKDLGLKDIDIKVIKLKFLFGEKIAAGSFTLIQSLLYFFTAFVVTRA